MGCLTSKSKKELSIIGIYCIFNVGNGKKYVGSSVNVYRRMTEHLRQLNKGIHCNSHLQSSWCDSEFQLEILEKTSEEFLAERESFWINFYKSTDDNFGYNQSDVTVSRRNKLSEKSKQKISASLMSKYYGSGISIKMMEKENKSILMEFGSLKEAAVYLMKNGLTQGKEHVVRGIIGQTLKSRKVHTGKGNLAKRKSAFGFLWSY